MVRGSIDAQVAISCEEKWCATKTLNFAFSSVWGNAANIAGFVYFSFGTMSLEHAKVDFADVYGVWYLNFLQTL